MHILWKKKVHATNRQTGEPTCPHLRKRKPRTLTPIMNHYDAESKKYKAVWRIGPSIRECCLENELALAAWWYEVNQRFDDLAKFGIEEDQALARVLLAERTLIDKLLQEVVPKPSRKALLAYLDFRALHQKPRRVKVRLPGFVKVLELTTWPVDEAELKAAWRKLAMQHHPDRGGDTATFIAAKAAYETAVRHLA